MGCDFYWDAREPDVVRQRGASMFIQSWALRRGLRCVAYNGAVEGYFLDRGKDWMDLKNFQTVTRKTQLELIGVEIEGLHEFSFVFNNSPHPKPARRHRLITLTKFSDFGDEHAYLRRFFDVGELDPSETYGFYKDGGYTRMIGGGIDGLATFLYMLRRRYLPGLVVDDDYNVFDGMWAHQPEVPREFDEDRVVIPEVKMKWAVVD